ncbi:MAG: ribonuclease R [Alphaproteobacteria bacterium]|nr:ribonuclease R [Alphaproteobacteria bacterium]
MKARVLELLAENSGADKRDLARLLGLKGSDRIQLKRVLKELAAEGVIEGRKRTGFTRKGELPEVAVIRVTGLDADGEMLAAPLAWDSNEEPPTIYVTPPKTGGAPGPGDRLLARLEPVGGRSSPRPRDSGDAYEAVIIRKLEAASPSRLVGVVRESPQGARLVPIDKKARGEYAIDKADLGGAKNNELVAAEPVHGRIAGFAKVRVVERIGSMDSPRTISLIAIHDHGIPVEFPEAALDQAKAAQPIDAKGRTDLRSVPLLTIDPPDARDHDDAIWAGPDPDHDGGHIVLVAIADVAHYVTSGSALDKEAIKRGNSTYFPDRVVPMLPEELSADLCSLKEGVDRPCLAVRMVFDAHGHKKSHQFLRGVMRSAARLTYAQAQSAFGGNPPAGMSALVKTTLAGIWEAYRSLTIARGKRDPLDLDLPERRVVLGADGHVASIAFRERLESMKLIEEFMVLANVAAAEALEKARTPLIYRVHDTPSKEKLFAFADFLRTLNIAFAKGQVVQPGVFNRILKASKGMPHEAVMSDVVLRSQAQAIYDPANIGHFGLNLAKYAHFTSPIRRYADLIVHRALIRAFGLGDGGLTDKEIAALPATAEHITMTERRAMAAERDSTDRYVAAFMQDRVGDSFDARVTGVTRFGLFVRLAESGAEGLIPIRSLGADFFRHDEKRQALVGERSHTVFRLGDVLAVKLVEAAPITGGLRFAIMDGRGGEGAAMPAHRPGRPHRTPKRSKAAKPARNKADKRKFKPKKS